MGFGRDERLKGFLEKGMDGIHTQLLFFTKGLAVVRRIEEEYESEKNGILFLDLMEERFWLTHHDWVCNEVDN